MGQAGVHQCPVSISFPSGFNSSDRMTPLWYPCLRVWESVSHYLFNAPAPAAQPHSSEITFLARSSPPRQFGEEQATKSLTHWVFLSFSFTPLSLNPPYSSSSPSWILRRWAVWTRTMRTVLRSLSRCSTVTPSHRWRRRSWTRCTRICPTHCDHGLQTWISVRPRGAQSQRRRNSFIILFPVRFLAENLAHCIVWIMTEKEKKCQGSYETFHWWCVTLKESSQPLPTPVYSPNQSSTSQNWC